MFKLKIVTPNELFFEGEVEHLMAPGYNGCLGVLQNHAPFVTPITQGSLSYRDKAGQTKTLKVEGGFLEVLKNKVLVLTDKVQGTAVV